MEVWGASLYLGEDRWSLSQRDFPPPRRLSRNPAALQVTLSWLLKPQSCRITWCKLYRCSVNFWQKVWRQTCWVRQANRSLPHHESSSFVLLLLQMDWWTLEYGVLHLPIDLLIRTWCPSTVVHRYQRTEIALVAWQANFQQEWPWKFRDLINVSSAIACEWHWHCVWALGSVSTTAVETYHSQQLYRQ